MHYADIIPHEEPFDEPTDERRSAPRKPRMPGQHHVKATARQNAALYGVSNYPRHPAPADAPRSIADLPVSTVCICAVLPGWARPCGPCKWGGR